MKFILGQKLEMTQVFNEKNHVIPVTKVFISPNVITQIKTIDKEGYNAIQLSSVEKKKVNKAQAGHFKKLGGFRFSKEIRVDEIPDSKVGDLINIDIFNDGDNINVTGCSKGKGFAGVVKRHGFHGQMASHGTKDQLRMPGSIGATGPAHVFKGTKMGGHMGSEKTTVTNLKVVKIDKKNNIVYVKGAIPGARGSLIILKENN